VGGSDGNRAKIVGTISETVGKSAAASDSDDADKTGCGISDTGCCTAMCSGNRLRP